MIILLILFIILFSSPAFAGGVMFDAGGVDAGGVATISDDFSTDTSGNYTSIRASRGMVVASGQAKAENGTFGGDHYSHNNTTTGSPNHYYESYVVRGGSNGVSGAIVRCSGSGLTSTGYTVAPNSGSTTSISLGSFTAPTGAPTFVDQWTTAEVWADNVGHKIRVEVSGSNFQLYVDWGDDGGFGEAGDDEGVKVDATYTTGNYIGLYFYANGSTTIHIDDLVGDAL